MDKRIIYDQKRIREKAYINSFHSYIYEYVA